MVYNIEKGLKNIYNIIIYKEVFIFHANLGILKFSIYGYKLQVILFTKNKF